MTGADAALVRCALAAMVDALEEELDEELYDPWDWGVTLFDNLDRDQRVALLALVATALFDPLIPAPPLTAVTEATIGAIFSAAAQEVQIEIDHEADLREMPDLAAGVDQFSWRRRIRACFDAEGFAQSGMELVPLESSDSQEWTELVWSVADTVLWDDDWETEELIMDVDPETSRRRKERWGIAEDYYTAIPPDPTPAELAQAWERLRAITR